MLYTNLHVRISFTAENYMYTNVLAVLINAHIGCQGLYSVHCYFIMEDCVCGALL